MKAKRWCFSIATMLIALTCIAAPSDNANATTSAPTPVVTPAISTSSPTSAPTTHSPTPTAAPTTAPTTSPAVTQTNAPTPSSKAATTAPSSTAASTPTTKPLAPSPAAPTPPVTPAVATTTPALSPDGTPNTTSDTTNKTQVPTSTNSSGNSTSSSDKSVFFRADNGAMWSTFGGAAIIGIIIVVMLLRQKDEPVREDELSPPAKSTSMGEKPSIAPWTTPLPRPSNMELPPVLPIRLPNKSLDMELPPIAPRKDSTPMLEPLAMTNLASSLDVDSESDRLSTESEMAIRHVSEQFVPDARTSTTSLPGVTPFTTNEWAVAAGVHTMRPSSFDSDADICDNTSEMASAVFDRYSAASSAFSIDVNNAEEEPKRDSYEL
ncbi:hypothetical protein Ae201684P_019301 [Aphanomyces euteiches]|uniref:Uncharacterized protein n=1 Tax=Aphanomyces euteiches TaxID=100861 RepID=A0A6G0XE76_9STRA|nr:hypothetical protein Ae201684_005693 [Aphanomyces euteiches]KAH9078209.1 hypothetical protein Ae201684P_019301 [Aphanomyces euteiches]KAH9145428.1 hypothetical protein AeRB84_010654 [Aphanomyces euteiches]